MAVLGIRKNAWDGLSVRDKEIIRAIGGTLNLGVPALWKTPTNVEWFLFSDTRFRLVELAYFGCIAKNLADIPAGYTLPVDENGVLDRRQLRQDAKNFCENVATSPVVWPVDVEGSDNVWQAVLDAQGTPAAMQMADAPPATWSAVTADV